MAEIPKTYASPGLRWGLFLHDHPHAPDPTFRLARWDDPDVNVPEEWATGGQEGFTGEFCVCTVDPGDGSPKVVAWREIPSQERRGGKWIAYPKTPENWRKLTTMALGRCLKQLGLADDTEDLKALLLWRRRDVELRALAAGVSPPPALGSGPADSDLDAAARSEPHAEHPDSAAVAAESDPDESGGVDEVTIGADDQWSADAEANLRPLFARLTATQQAEVQAWADTKNYGPVQRLETGGKMRAVLARIRPLLGPNPTDAPPDPVPAAPGPPIAPPARESVNPPVDPNAKAHMPMVRSIYDAVQGLIGPEGDTEKAEVVFAAADFLAFDGWEEEGLTFGQVAQAWAALHSVEVYG